MSGRSVQRREYEHTCRSRTSSWCWRQPVYHPQHHQVQHRRRNLDVFDASCHYCQLLIEVGLHRGVHLPKAFACAQPEQGYEVNLTSTVLVFANPVMFPSQEEIRRLRDLGYCIVLGVKPKIRVTSAHLDSLANLLLMRKLHHSEKSVSITPPLVRSGPSRPLTPFVSFSACPGDSRDRKCWWWNAEECWARNRVKLSTSSVPHSIYTSRGHGPFHLFNWCPSGRREVARVLSSDVFWFQKEDRHIRRAPEGCLEKNGWVPNPPGNILSIHQVWEPETVHSSSTWDDRWSCGQNTRSYMGRGLGQHYS